jgi:hypothetical protein
MRYGVAAGLAAALVLGLTGAARSEVPTGTGASMMKPPIDFTDHPLKQWVKRTPGPDAPPNPRMGYETSYGWDPQRRILIRWGGHNQGGGGEQNAETWHYDPIANTWKLAEVNTCPPGNCCCRENVFDPAHGRFVRFPAFFHSHGWHWRRTGYTRDSSVWQYDPGTMTWRNMRPLPEPSPKPMRGAVWDSDAQVILLTAGENARDGTQVYDPHSNRWTAMKPAVELPQDRNTFGLAYDSKRKCYYAFGDQYGRDQRTWKYDLKSNTWTDLKPEHHPAKAQDGTVMVYDPVNDVVVANLRQDTEGGTEEKPAGRRETWIYHPDKNDWERLDTGKDVDFSGSRNTVMVYAPELNVVFLENRTLEMQIWTFRYGPAPKDAPPAAPTDITLRTDSDGATLTWKAVGAKNIAVYRGTGEKPWLVEYKKVKELPGEATSFADSGLTKGAVYFYYLTAVDGQGRESAPSLKVRTQPWVVQDVVVSPVEPKKLELEWPAPAADVVSYRIERADVQVYSMSELKQMEYKGPSTRLATAIGAIRAIGPFAAIAKDVKEPRFTDTTVDFAAGQKTVQGTPVYSQNHEKNRDPEGKPYPWAVYAYRVYATNALGVESGDSPWFLSVPDAVESVFSRERGVQVDIKWAAHKAKGVVGYNIYRMWDRYDSSTRFELLNEKPVAATTFTDEKSGTSAHFYFVAAVDALGQEGLISSPTWGHREYARFYKPFVGEWHQ